MTQTDPFTRPDCIAETSFIRDSWQESINQNPFSPAFCPGAMPPSSGALKQNAQDTDFDEDECSGGCGLGDDTPGVGPWIQEFDD